MKNIPTYYVSPHKIAGVDEKKSVLIALSGGADSTSLLHNLVSERERCGFDLYAAHVNHNIRLDSYGNEAIRDEQFCRDLCASLGVELFVLNADVPRIAKESGESIEGAARRVRYGFFKEIMKEKGISILVTAHNASDNFETQLFNLCRGSSISGIAGIPQKRPLDGVGVVVRPILSGTKAEILDFCEKNKIEFVTDSTNLETDVTRNKIRSLISPAIEELFPSAHRASSRLSTVASEVDEYMSLEAERFIGENARCIQNKMIISLKDFDRLHIALKREVIFTVAREFGLGLEFTHIQSVIELCKKANPHTRVDLPCSLECSIEDGCVIFAVSHKTEKTTNGFEIPFDGSLAVIGDYAVISDDEPKKLDGYALLTEATLNGDRIKDGILEGRAMLKSKSEGDRILDGGNNKKIKKLMCDKKIPLSERTRIPMLSLDGEIIYVPMCAISDVAKTFGESNTKIFIYKKL